MGGNLCWWVSRAVVSGLALSDRPSPNPNPFTCFGVRHHREGAHATPCPTGPPRAPQRRLAAAPGPGAGGGARVTRGRPPGFVREGIQMHFSPHAHPMPHTNHPHTHALPTPSLHHTHSQDEDATRAPARRAGGGPGLPRLFAPAPFLLPAAARVRPGFRRGRLHAKKKRPPPRRGFGGAAPDAHN